MRESVSLRETPAPQGCLACGREAVIYLCSQRGECAVSGVQCKHRPFKKQARLTEQWRTQFVVLSLGIAPSFPSLCHHLPTGLHVFQPKLVCLPPACLLSSPPGPQPWRALSDSSRDVRLPGPQAGAGSRLPCSPVPSAGESDRPPRPFVTWPRPTFSPTPRISGSSYTERLVAPQLPTGNSQPSGSHAISLSLGQ